MRKRVATVLAIVVSMLLCVAVSATAADDDITALVDSGRTALAEGNYQEALDLFQQVVQKIQAMVSQSFEQFLPGALTGWTAGEIESQSWAGTTGEGSHRMTHLTREYTREKDDARCTINITNWPHLVQGFQQSMQAYKQMEQLMSADPRMQVEVDSKDEWTILKVVDSTEKTVQLSAVHKKLMVSIEVDKEEVAVAEEYLGKINLTGLAGAAK
ncbi:MAG: hypothetical protein JSW58_07530 [Candidatus Latescibacterota bacterium]|nr:MAG: hypothetical protein JSW58_07530 [Candidatus Latescibacterota bacterium]